MRSKRPKSVEFEGADLLVDFPHGPLALVDQRPGARVPEFVQPVKLQLQGDQQLRRGIVQLARDATTLVASCCALFIRPEFRPAAPFMIRRQNSPLRPLR